jgi:hypothetical protein
MMDEDGDEDEQSWNQFVNSNYTLWSWLTPLIVILWSMIMLPSL